ncbi:MAG: sulfotransferase [Synechococcaceae cyanobacterium]|nr:sulfotransferase [Synechococcaceae cyanobacterium]
MPLRSVSPESRFLQGSQRGRLPDFLVVGSMKCGTTSLHHYLSLHPEVQVARKELNFFIGGDAYDPDALPSANWWRGTGWYRRQFSASRKICGDVSPACVVGPWRRPVAQRLAQLLPQARFVLLVREPLQRLQSHYLMARANLEIPAVTFAEFVENERFHSYRSYSHYGSQLLCLREWFPASSVLVIETAALDQDRERTLARIFSFLGVDPGFRTPGFRRRLHQGGGRRVATPAGERLLRSPLMVWAWDHLPFTVYEGLRALLLRPLSAELPSLVLPEPVAARLRQEFSREVRLVRRLSGEPLRSLGE